MDHRLDRGRDMKAVKYNPTMNEQEIVGEIVRRVRELLSDRNMQPGKEAWIAWEEGEDGQEMASLINMLDASELYFEDEFKDEL